MIAPVKHPNGTSGKELDANFQAAYEAMCIFTDMLTNMWPNARDYYVISPEAYEQAKAEHLERCQHLRAIRASMDELATVWPFEKGTP